MCSGYNLERPAESCCSGVFLIIHSPPLRLVDIVLDFRFCIEFEAEHIPYLYSFSSHFKHFPLFTFHFQTSRSLLITFCSISILTKASYRPQLFLISFWFDNCFHTRSQELISEANYNIHLDHTEKRKANGRCERFYHQELPASVT